MRYDLREAIEANCLKKKGSGWGWCFLWTLDVQDNLNIGVNMQRKQHEENCYLISFRSSRLSVCLKVILPTKYVQTWWVVQLKTLNGSSVIGICSFGRIVSAPEIYSIQSCMDFLWSIIYYSWRKIVLRCIGDVYKVAWNFFNKSFSTHERK